MQVRRSLRRGDTIIEVIFAVAVFSFVAISSLAIMNQGIATGEKALEITQVRQQINAQAETLRFIHEARVVDTEYGKLWSELITEYGQEDASPYGVSGNECLLPSSSYSPFVLNARTVQIWDSLTMKYEGSEALPPYSQVAYNDDGTIKAAYGLWIEAVPSEIVVATDKRFVDFHIRACWPAPGSSVPMTIGTIVRLYDPS